jgi:hypothetical protein
MATAARAAKRRSTRKDENGDAGPAKGVPSPVEPPEPQEGQEQVAGVFVRVTGKYQVEVQPLGDTRVTELETLLKLALGRAKEMVRLDD